MTTNLVIPKERIANDSENYQFLREKGLEYIESLSSDLWTDYNVHDPGITLLEALCYAITELGYRTGFEMKDLLAREGKDYSESIAPLFTAKNILTNSPLTQTDFRKVLVDLEGVKNAWLEIADCQEVDFYANCKKSELSYFQPDHKIKFTDSDYAVDGKKNKVLKIIIDDKSNSDQLSIDIDLSLKATDLISGDDITHDLIVPLPGWTEVDLRFSAFLDFINLDSMTNISLVNTTFNNSAETWQSDIQIDFVEDGNAKSINFLEVLVIDVADTSVQDALETALTALGSDNVFEIYRQKLLYGLSRELEHTISLRGLYEVLLEYDVDHRYGDLNSDLLYFNLMSKDATGRIEELELEILMPSWNEIYEQIETYDAFIDSKAVTKVNLSNNFHDNVNFVYTADLTLQYDGQGGAPDIVWDNVKFRNVKTAVDVTELEGQMLSILNFFHGKLERLYSITKEAERTLHQYRSLCEDYKKISGICVNNIGVCVDIILENDASLINTQAEVYYKIQQYLSPEIPFYTLKEMVAKGIPSESIFNGPNLAHGFILDEEIEASDLGEKRFIYASDLINLIMDVDGVLAVKDLLLTKYDKSGDPVLPSQSWCLELDAKHKAELSIPNSKVLFYKDQLPYVLSEEKEDEMIRELERLKAINAQSKLIDTDLDFPVPEGTPIDLENYSPVRFSLPQNYGVGAAGLPDTETDERKGKAKQLQAFLTFYDQMLANSFSQLANIDELFSIEKHEANKLKKTYYNQFISADQLGADLYVDAGVLEDAGGSVIGPNSLQRLTESSDDYLDRRNRFLDHLLARFAENFTDYALMVFSTNDDSTQQELINDKVSFLEEYPIISSERGKGFNYKDETALWDTDNVVGIKKRVSKLLGMSSYQRRTLHCPTIRNDFAVVPSGSDFTFELVASSITLLTSPLLYAEEDDAFYAMEKAIKLARERESYKIVEVAGQFIFQIGDPSSGSYVVYAESAIQYVSADAAETAADGFRTTIDSEFSPNPPRCDEEGLFVLEHILLRPRQEYEDQMIDVCLGQDCFFCGEEDPYSFRASVVLPYWMNRFSAEDSKLRKREYVERILRQEAPAHVHLKICWVDNFQMRELEVHYQRWLEENAKRFPDPDKLTRRLNALIQILGELRSRYPEGFLHDCDDSEETNTIILGKSFLGAYNPPPESEK